MEIILQNILEKKLHDSVIHRKSGELTKEGWKARRKNSSAGHSKEHTTIIGIVEKLLTIWSQFLLHRYMSIIKTHKKEVFDFF